MTSRDMIIIGAGPAGISMAVEARAAGVAAHRLLVLEKAAEHSFTLKRYYPEGKLVTANYKGFEAACTGVMCIPDLTKQETITYIDTAIREAGVDVRYAETVHRIAKHDTDHTFTVESDRDTYAASVVVIAIGILGKPNKPGYRLPPSLKNRLLFDVTSVDIREASVLVVGGGDSASEYCQYLVQQGNRVTLSYRKHEFARMNRINRESLRALEERGEVRILYGTDIAGVSDLEGRPRVTFAGIPADAPVFDYVVYALGGTTPNNFLKAIGIEFEGDKPVTSDGHETNVPGLFLVGDLSAGPMGGSIIWAFNSANTVMRRICAEYLKCGSGPAE